MLTSAVPTVETNASIRATVSPADGPFQLIYAFEAVIIGGMGSIWGAFLGAMVLGVSQSIGNPAATRSPGTSQRAF